MPSPRNMIRWFLRRRLRRFGSNVPVTPDRWRGILYLFAGTYGDAVQILSPLRALAAAAPQARIFLCAPVPIFAAFRMFFPKGVVRVGYFVAVWHCRRGTDLVCTNAIGVYRVRYDFLAALAACAALGFRHVEEKKRAAYSVTLPLTPAIRNFESANLALLRLAGISAPVVPAAAVPSGAKLLLHVGSVGFKRRVGRENYLSLLRTVLETGGDRVEEILYGPGDEEIIRHLDLGDHAPLCKQYDLDRLAHRVREHGGHLVCVDGFFAHFCRYLRRSAIVFHWDAVPYGYDCDPPHRQFLLPAGAVWDREELRRIVSNALQLSGSPPADL